MRTWMTIVDKSILRRRSDRNDIETCKDIERVVEFAYNPLKRVYGHKINQVLIDPNGKVRIQINIDGKPGEYELY